MGFIELILAIILFAAFITIGIIHTLYSAIVRNKFFKEAFPKLSYKSHATAYLIDCIGAVWFADLFNRWFLVPGSTLRFGDGYLSISEYIGWAEYRGQLTPKGKKFSKFLDLLLFEKQHALKSIGKA